VISGDMALCGFDNGRVVAAGLADGDVLGKRRLRLTRSD
jgi:hypothetical protein